MPQTQVAMQPLVAAHGEAPILELDQHKTLLTMSAWLSHLTTQQWPPGPILPWPLQHQTSQEPDIVIQQLQHHTATV